MVNWDAADLRTALEAAQMVAQMTIERSSTQMYITQAVIERWFAPTTTSPKERPTYAQHLARFLNVAEIHAVQDIFTRSLLDQIVTWASSTVFIKVKAST
jgi:putative ATPase